MYSTQSSLRLKSSIFAAQYSSTYLALNMDCVSDAIQKIFTYLDGKSRCTVRQVCHTWKQIMDEDVGLYLRVDDRLKDNPCFVRIIRIERAFLQNVDTWEKYISFKFPEFIKMLICTGPTPAKWFHEKVLSKSIDLTRLELSGRFLFSNDLCTCDPSTSNGKNNPVHLPNLKTLIMVVDSATCEDYLHERKPQGRLQVVWGAIVGCGLQDLYFLRETVDQNVSYLLHTIRSARLQLFYLFVDPLHFLEPSNNLHTFQWKKDPLERFLEYHRNTLKRLYLPTFEANSIEIQDFRIFPENLKTLELSLVQKGRHRKYSFSEKILVNQTVLEELRLEKSYVGEFRNSDKPQLSGMMKKNERTLRYVNLTVSAPDHELLNGTLFKDCFNLETLLFGEANELLEFYNFCDLPKSLKFLKICPLLILTQGDLTEIPKFRNLETLQLYDIQVQTDTPVQRHTFQINFLQALFHLRHLSTLLLQFSPCPSNSYSKPLNSMIESMAVKRLHESTEELQTLDIHGKHRHSQLPHFLDTCPFTRVEIDPIAKGKGQGQNSSAHHWKHDCEILGHIVVNSNIFNATSGPRQRPDDDDMGWIDFCTSIYLLD